MPLFEGGEEPLLHQPYECKGGCDAIVDGKRNLNPQLKE